MIKRKDKELSIGQMAGNMKEAGKMVNNMEPETIHLLVVKLNKADGKKVKDYNG